MMRIEFEILFAGGLQFFSIIGWTVRFGASVVELQGYKVNYGHKSEM